MVRFGAPMDAEAGLAGGRAAQAGGENRFRAGAGQIALYTLMFSIWGASFLGSLQESARYVR
jgi:hypothetical protein